MAENNNAPLWSPITISDTVSALAAQSRSPKNDLDKDAFLKLLITQMKYQDPLNPMDDKEFVGQMAQFTALEQMQNLNATFAKSHAYSMIGKTVYAYYPDPVTGMYNEASGLVSAVTMKNGEAYAYVEGQDVPVSAITVVGDDYFTAQQLNNIFEGVVNTRDMNFVGRYIQALIMNGEEVVDYVEGKVDYVKFNGAQSVLVVGDKEVFPHEVASVSDDRLLVGKNVIIEVPDESGAAGDTILRECRILTVAINKGKAALVVEDGGTTPATMRNVPIDKINYVMEALQCVGKEIKFNDIDGTVDSVTIKNGLPYLNVGGKELSYTYYKGITK